MSLQDVFSELLSAYGKRGWWPVTPAGEKRPRYIGGPTTEQQTFEVMVGAVLTQNTSWMNLLAAAKLWRTSTADTTSSSRISRCLIQGESVET